MLYTIFHDSSSFPSAVAAESNFRIKLFFPLGFTFVSNYRTLVIEKQKYCRNRSFAIGTATLARTG